MPEVRIGGLKCVTCGKAASYVIEGRSLCEEHFKEMPKTLDAKREALKSIAKTMFDLDVVEVKVAKEKDS